VRVPAEPSSRARTVPSRILTIGAAPFVAATSTCSQGYGAPANLVLNAGDAVDPKVTFNAPLVVPATTGNGFVFGLLRNQAFSTGAPSKPSDSATSTSSVTGDIGPSSGGNLGPITPVNDGIYEGGAGIAGANPGFSITSIDMFFTINNTDPNQIRSIIVGCDTTSASTVPEPSSLALLGMAMVGLGLTRRRGKADAGTAVAAA
jgi:hypothetical protein